MYYTFTHLAIDIWTASMSLLLCFRVFKLCCKPQLSLEAWFPKASCDLCPLKFPSDLYHRGHLEFVLLFVCVLGSPVSSSRVGLESYLVFLCACALLPTQGAQIILVELDPR